MTVPMRNKVDFQWMLSDSPFGYGEKGTQKIDETDDSHVHGDTRGFTIPASQTDYELDLTDIVTAGAMLFIRADRECGIKLNSDAASLITLKQLQTNGYAYFFVTADVTKVYVTTGSNDTKLSLSVTGDTV